MNTCITKTDNPQHMMNRSLFTSFFWQLLLFYLAESANNHLVRFPVNIQHTQLNLNLFES